MYKFKSLSQHTITGRGLVFCVKNPKKCDDFKHLRDQEVSIDGKIYIVKGVEFFAHCAPWKRGENIGLLVNLVL